MFEGIGSTFKYSFSQFKWSEIKIILLVSLKATKSGLRHLAKYLFFSILGAVAIALAMILVRPIPPLLRIALIVLIFIWVFTLGLAVILALRPTIEKKDFKYFISGIVRSIFSLLFYSFSYSIVFQLIPYGVYSLLLFKNPLLFSSEHPYIYGSISAIASTAAFISFLFYLDSRERKGSLIHSWRNGLKQVVYFAPVFFLLQPIISFVVVFTTVIPFGLILLSMFRLCPGAIVQTASGQLMLTNYLFGGFATLIAVIYFIFLMTFFFSISINYYTKIKHSHSKLFIK